MVILMAPTILIVIWAIFVLSTHSMVSLVMLLLTSLTLPLMFMEHVKVFWPCGLLLILMSTGLIVVFAYVVSLHSYKYYNSKMKWIKFACLSGALGILVVSSEDSLSYKTPMLYSGAIVSPLLSLILMSLLLFLVVSFIRIVYSKGGGFRKKF